MSEGLFDHKRWKKLIEKPWFLGAAVLVVAFGSFIVFATMYLFAKAAFANSTPELRDVGLLVLAIFGSPFVIWRAIVAQGNLDRSKDRDYADLFTKAVEQLGATREVREWDEETKRDVYRHEPNIEVRLGAIYALERISQDSERDHIAVVEVLCAYVRENAPREGTNNIAADDEETFFLALNSTPFPRSDIQVVLRSVKNISVQYPGLSFDFSNTNLRNAGFSGLRCKVLDLSFSKLDGCRFDSIKCDLRLRGSYGRCAFFSHVNSRILEATGSDFEYAVFKSSSLRRSNLSMSKFKNVIFVDVDFSNSNLSFCEFDNAAATDCNFTDTETFESNFGVIEPIDDVNSSFELAQRMAMSALRHGGGVSFSRADSESGFLQRR